MHGAFEPFVDILQAAGLIDANKKWIGGTSVLVQTGDVFDRGAGVREALDLLMRLEGEANRAGGRVEPLLGNHEMMNLMGDFRDVSAEAYAHVRRQTIGGSPQARLRRLRAIAKRRAGKGDPIATRDEWMSAHPPGFVEYVDAIGPRGASTAGGCARTRSCWR